MSNRTFGSSINFESITYLKLFYTVYHLLATYPLDITKTRLQIQGEAALNKCGGFSSSINDIKGRGMLHTAVGISKYFFRSSEISIKNN